MRTLAPVLCTSGLAAEARIARAAGFQVIVGAGDYRRTVLMLDAASGRAKCFISFGIAGGLAPHLKPGDVILSTEVVGEERRWRSDARFTDRFAELARQIGATQGPVFGARNILVTESEKARAWRDTGALSVDLESAAVAQAAEIAGVPFVVLRTIADPAAREMPPAALIPLSPRGRPAFLRVFGDVVRRPHQVGALLELARDYRQALAALAYPAQALRGTFVAA